MIPSRLPTLSSSGPFLSRAWNAESSLQSSGLAIMFDQAAKLPGVRCPKCFAQGVEVWVIPGKNCKECGTPCG
ncbi:hypothetical protein XA68_12423 [Ophiocordyceps unilateralis]|uniref:Uncharacterized protein n=1 Tax=Ophiocordyceps unilateralis TaxID=268505 RepID=A0A2A9PES0_OPHUN|nr:hypothetical protein XA68_12423 [Ophiocordyceps unilateralis]